MIYNNESLININLQSQSIAIFKLQTQYNTSIVI